MLGELALDVPVEGPEERPLVPGLLPPTPVEGAELPGLPTGEAEAAGAGAAGGSAAAAELPAPPVATFAES